MYIIYVYTGVIICICQYLHRYTSVTRITTDRLCMSRLDDVSFCIRACPSWPRNAAKAMFPRISTSAPWSNCYKVLRAKSGNASRKLQQFINLKQRNRLSYFGRIYPIPTMTYAVTLWWGDHYSFLLSPWCSPKIPLCDPTTYVHAQCQTSDLQSFSI